MQDRVKELMEELGEHEDWYYTRAWWTQVFYVTLVAIAAVSGVVSTVLLNLEWMPKEGLWHNVATTLPAVGSIASVVLATFGIRELWQLRETGIYDVKALEIEFEAAMLREPTRIGEIRLDIREKLRKIEERQARRVIGALAALDRV